MDLLALTGLSIGWYMADAGSSSEDRPSRPGGSDPPISHNRNMSFDYKVGFYSQDDGSWVADIPGGCHTLMDTHEAALRASTPRQAAAPGRARPRSP